MSHPRAVETVSAVRGDVSRKCRIPQLRAAPAPRVAPQLAARLRALAAPAAAALAAPALAAAALAGRQLPEAARVLARGAQQPDQRLRREASAG